VRDIDFLPEGYRQKTVRRKDWLWRVLVVVAFVALVAAATWIQQVRRRSAEARLALARQSEEAVNFQLQTLRGLQERLSALRQRAELIAYLHHPWPRTQILAEALLPLPDSVRLEELHVRQRPADEPTGRRGQRYVPESLPSERDLDGLPPAVADLKRISREGESQPVTVLLIGTTTDAERLLAYVGQMKKVRLFSDAELLTIESRPEPGRDAESLQFRVRITVRPGIGQPGGPAESDAPDVAARPAP
jgi:Tfp pilus assembly protein PilN